MWPGVTSCALSTASSHTEARGQRSCSRSNAARRDPSSVAPRGAGLSLSAAEDAAVGAEAAAEAAVARTVVVAVAPVAAADDDDDDDDGVAEGAVAAAARRFAPEGNSSARSLACATNQHTTSSATCFARIAERISTISAAVTSSAGSPLPLPAPGPPSIAGAEPSRSLMMRRSAAKGRVRCIRDATSNQLRKRSRMLFFSPFFVVLGDSAAPLSHPS